MVKVISNTIELNLLFDGNGKFYNSHRKFHFCLCKWDNVIIALVSYIYLFDVEYTTLSFRTGLRHRFLN